MKISACKLQLEEYKRVTQGKELDEARMAKVQKGEWMWVEGLSLVQTKSQTGSRPKKVVRNREVRQPEVIVRMIEKEREW